MSDLIKRPDREKTVKSNNVKVNVFKKYNNVI